ncbi:MAG TPA: DNA polymerase/3'-5' exonuclease PolX [Planctomycetota bacterium]|nr:DNA polymerase/3'-5' exonuclease PolX [Planctomycetota bacterium]
MLKNEVAMKLHLLADLLEVQSENPFQARAYRNAARALESMTGALEDAVSAGTLIKVPGIGKSIAKDITELAGTGTSARLTVLEAAVPPGLRDLLRVPGLGSTRARALCRDLGIDGIASLKAACEDGRVAELKGFGEKTTRRILEGIAYIASVAGRFRIDQILPSALDIEDHMRRSPAIERVEVCGSLRRRRETIKDIDIVASSSRPELVMEHFIHAPRVAAVVARGPTKTSVRLSNGIGADLRVVTGAQFPAALQYFTGSSEHNTILRGIARDLGLKLNEYGLFRGEEPLPLEDEGSIYAALGLDLVPPELREGLGEIGPPRPGGRPRLVERGDLQGMLHVHTTWSDGTASIEDMARGARERGYTYIGITDHSQSAAYARGLSVERVLQQHEEIDRLNARGSGIRIWKGIESDIRPDGSLDYEPDVLDRFDFVIASVHSSFKLPEDVMTDRVLRALADPHTTFLGHPTGRLLLARDAYAIHMDRVLAAAAAMGVAVELNADPHRLDLDWRHGARARELGVMTSIHPDAHSVGGMDNVDYGIGIARKGGFSREQVVNALDVRAFEDFVRRRKR